MSRPTYSSANTATTLLSATSCTSASDLASTTYDSTALTTPDLSSPKKGQSGRLETIDDVFVSTPLAGQAFDPAGGDRTRQLSRNRSKSPVMEYRKEERYLESPRRTSLDLSRGPSVKDRAREFEASRSSVTPSSSRPLPSPLQSRTTSSVTTPLRINKTQSTVTTGPSASGSRAYSSLGVGPSPSVAPAYSSAGTGMSTSGSTPRTAKRIPVPSTVSTSKTTSTKHHTDALSPVRSASKGATRKMIQQWESLPSTPAAAGSASSPTTKRVISRDYLDQKPLPIPSASAIASSGPSTPNRATNSAYQVSPARTTYAPSPLYRSHLQTPDAGPSRKRQSVSPSGSAYSLSPSGDKRRKGKSPLKDMLNVFGGGIQAIGRKAKEKGRGMSRYGSRDSLASKGQDSLWSQPSERVGTNGLPGGIVYSDRMGDKEMLRRQSDPTVIRGSAVVYLIPTPCSSVSQWGSWLTSWAILHPHQLKITYCPVFQNPQSGNSTPKRILSGTGPNQTTSGPAVPFSSIPPPELGSEPDVELDMTNCVEVRSLRKEEVRGRGIPAVPEGVSTEVLEMVWGDGSKRYIGVEGVGGRLGWVSAIWDVLLACKPEQLRELPPPSPAMLDTQNLPPSDHGHAQSISLDAYPFSTTDDKRTSSYSALQQRVADYESKTAASSAPPIQKVGDTWVAASVVGRASGSEADLRPLPEPDALRDSVQRMFDKGPDARVPSRSDSEATARIKAWQPTTERELSIFSRSGSKRSQASIGPLSADQHVALESQVYTETKSDTVLSFDPNDLNPSRSASQVRRTPTLVGGDQPTIRRRGGPLTVVEERSDDGLTEAMRAATHISHITFPKPIVTTALNIPHRLLTPIPSASESSTESGETTAMVTPHTSRSVVSVHTLEGSVLDKLDSHSSEHSDIAKQVDGVQNGLQAAITTLSALLAQSKILSDPMQAPVPRALEDRLSSLGLDVKGLENAIQLSSLAAKVQAVEEPKLPELNAKLDTIARACAEILAMHKQNSATAVVPDDVKADKTTLANLPPKASVNDAALPPNTQSKVSGSSASRAKPVTPPQPQKRSSLNVVTDPKDEKEAGEEVAQIMAQLTGGSAKASPRLVGLQVLHNSAPNSPKSETGSKTGLPTSDAVTQQVTQLLALVKEMKDGRATEINQNTDIVRYLKDINTWLEKGADSNSKNIAELSDRLKPFTGEPATDTSEAIPGLPVLMTDVHSMMLEQKRRNDEEARMGQRVDNLLQMMAEERERMADQQTMMSHVTSQIERLRQENVDLLQAFTTDLTLRVTEEIKKEQKFFVQEISKATKLDIHHHASEFRRIVKEHHDEVEALEHQKRGIQAQLSDFLALQSKLAPNPRQKSAKPTQAPSQVAPAPPAQAATRPSPGRWNPNLPVPPQ